MNSWRPVRRSTAMDTSMFNSISENSGGQLSNLLCSGIRRTGRPGRSVYCADRRRCAGWAYRNGNRALQCAGIPGNSSGNPSPVDPIDAGAVPLDPLLQNLADARPKSSCLFLRERVWRASKGEGEPGQGFISIDIPDACQEGLIQQERLQLAMFLLETLKEISRR